MRINELDVVELKDGRTATVLEVFGSGKAFLVEVADSKGKTLDMPTVEINDIARVTWKNND